MSPGWVEAGDADAIPKEDVTRFGHDGRTFAVYRTADDRDYATDGLCPHQQVHLAGGFVAGPIIECPKHDGRVDFVTGKAKGAPVCVDLRTHRQSGSREDLFADRLKLEADVARPNTMEHW